MYPLSLTETAGVVGVGFALAFGANAVSNRARTGKGHQRAMLLGGVTLYTLGVVIGAKWKGK